MFNNITKKRLGAFLLSTLLFLSMFGSKAFAEDRYIIKTISIKTALETYNIEISKFHEGSVSRKNQQEYHFNIYVKAGSVEIQNHHIWLDKKSNCWKDWESYSNYTAGLTTCYNDGNLVVVEAMENAGSYGLANEFAKRYYFADSWWNKNSHPVAWATKATDFEEMQAKYKMPMIVPSPVGAIG